LYDLKGMTLREVIGNVENLSDDLTIYATKAVEWDIDAPAALVLSSDTEEIGIRFEDLSYFLEVEIAKEVLSVWSEWRNGTNPNELERIEALIYYADNDAYIG